MSGFFSKIIFRKVDCKTGSFELPILYFREDSFVLFYSADLEKVKALMPAQSLHPVVVSKGRAVVAFAAFNYIETTIGPYGEFAIAVPVVHKRRVLPILPLLREANCPGFGMMVLQLPVTNLVARDAGREVWGYPKFTAHMEFDVTPEFLRCRVFEDGRLILRMRVPRRGVIRRDNRPLVTYSVKDGDLIRTVIKQRAVYMTDIFPDGVLELGDHPVADLINQLGLSRRPFASRVYLYRPAILPSGEVIERGVGDIERFEGSDKDCTLTVRYRSL